MHSANPHGSLTPAEPPLIAAEKLSEQPGPPHFHNVQTELMLGSTTSTARAKANAIDDMQVFYTGATIKF